MPFTEPSWSISLATDSTGSEMKTQSSGMTVSTLLSLSVEEEEEEEEGWRVDWLDPSEFSIISLMSFLEDQTK